MAEKKENKYKKKLEDLYVSERKKMTVEGNEKAQKVDAALRAMEGAEKAPLKSEQLEKYTKSSKSKKSPAKKGRAK
jgi:hypothetical protein